MSIHKSKEWLEKREKFIEGKVCEWCGSEGPLHIHHINPPAVGLPAYMNIIKNILKTVKTNQS
jgi:hypothetical protein